MQPQLHQEITRRLLADFSFKEQGDWLRQGVCPDCQKKELYTYAISPWVLRCGRLNKCNAEIHIKEVYPDLFESWSDRYPPTPENPQAAADAYLREMRGFDLSLLRNCYAQENYYDARRDLGSATVRFPLADGVWWERIVDRPQRFGDRKANFHGAYSGLWWQLPTLKLEEQQEIWLVEGIFDAIALHHHGIAAVSLMTCNNYPAQALSQLAALFVDKKRPLLVWALDNDKAGMNYTRRWVKRSRDDGWLSTAAQTPYSRTKLDWNDLHQRDRLNPDLIKKYRYYGSLLIAPNPNAKALLMHERTERKEFHFEFDSRLYWFKLDIDRYMRAFDNVMYNGKEELDEEEAKHKALQESAAVVEIANCYPTALYYQANTITDESWYYFRINFPDDTPPIKNTFTGSQLSSGSEFKKRLLHIAQGGIFTGTSQQLDKLLLKQLPKIKTVQTTDFIGYSKEYRAYVFNDLAVRDGRLYTLNEEDFFDMDKLSLKSLNQSVSLTLNDNLKQMDSQWPQLLWQAFGAKGFVALAYWFGTMFAEQIRDKHKSFPFLEIVGEPGSGKTTLIEFLWKLLGRRDYEGFDPSKSTLAARARNFAQVANMPVVLIEGDRNQEGAKQRGFDWEELKTAYNGRSVRSRGLRNSGNETYEPPFRGAIVIAQNADVSASNPVLERIIHLYTDRSGQNTQTKVAAEQLERLPVEQLSGFMLKAALAEQAVLECVNRQIPLYEQQLHSHPDIRHIRIIKNHAQLMALLDALALVIPVTEEQLQATREMFIRLSLERQQAISADHPLVQEFWDIFDFLDGDDEPQLNHSRDEQLIAVNLNHFIQLATERRQQIPPISDLKRVLKTSRTHKFIEVRTVNSGINAEFNRRYPAAPRRPATVKCWVFQR
ncbi:TPA: toprim domain-containing protein [Escherichia coli]